MKRRVFAELLAGFGVLEPRERWRSAGRVLPAARCGRRGHEPRNCRRWQGRSLWGRGQALPFFRAVLLAAITSASAFGVLEASAFAATGAPLTAAPSGAGAPAVPPPAQPPGEPPPAQPPGEPPQAQPPGPGAALPASRAPLGPLPPTAAGDADAAPSDAAEPAESLPSRDDRPRRSHDAAAARSLPVLGGESGNYGRLVADEALVLPAGQELLGQLRLVTARQSLGDAPVRLTDVALFELGFNVAVNRKTAIALDVALLPKQPSFTRELGWQSAGLALRRQVRKMVIGGAVRTGALLARSGYWAGGSAFVEYRKRLNEVVHFGFVGGGNGLALGPTQHAAQSLVEASGSASLLLRNRQFVGAWASVGYAVPLWSHGPVRAATPGFDPDETPVGERIDPQPRLDLQIGASMMLADKWDLLLSYSIVDRGDLGRPATILPILDGGFDQHQITVGVSRRLDLKWRKRNTAPSMGLPLQLL